MAAEENISAENVAAGENVAAPKITALKTS
jgi:hypothetical protein